MSRKGFGGRNSWAFFHAGPLADGAQDIKNAVGGGGESVAGKGEAGLLPRVAGFRRSVENFCQHLLELCPIAARGPLLQIVVRQQRGQLFGNGCGRKLIDGNAVFLPN